MFIPNANFWLSKPKEVFFKPDVKNSIDHKKAAKAKLMIDALFSPPKRKNKPSLTNRKAGVR